VYVIVPLPGTMVRTGASVKNVVGYVSPTITAGGLVMISAAGDTLAL